MLLQHHYHYCHNSLWLLAINGGVQRGQQLQRLMWHLCSAFGVVRWAHDFCALLTVAGQASKMAQRTGELQVKL